METALSNSKLSNYKTKNLPGVDSEEEEQKQETQQSLTEQLQKMHRSRCQMTIMGYIDDDSQRAELQEAMTFEINRIMGDYNKESFELST